MAKKRATGLDQVEAVETVEARPARLKQQELAGGEWGDKVPKQVQDVADAYVDAVRAQAEALGDKNRLYDELLSVMRQHGMTKIRIADENGELKKLLVIEAKETIKIQKLKTRKPDEEEELDDYDESSDADAA